MTRENLTAARCISYARGLKSGEPYYIDESNPVYIRDGVFYVDVYNLKRKWIGMAPRRAFSVLKTEEITMKKISNNTRENYNLLEELIESNGISGREVLDIFTDYFGLQLCSKDFMENLRDCEGYELPESED